MRRPALLAALAAIFANGAGAQDAVLKPVRPVSCPATAETCSEYDAIVFVHGIYGADETFVNPKTNFNWPSEIPEKIQDRQVDVFLLNYKTTLLTWAKNKNSSFDDLGDAVLGEMGQLRRRQYRSIGFIAHSLGGNVVSTYLHSVKSRYGHPARAAHAYAINIATPALGSHIADIGHQLKSLLGMQDDLLRSLKRDDVYQRMLLNFQNYEGAKSSDLGCRQTDFYVGYETRALAMIKIVQEESARRLKPEQEEKARSLLPALQSKYKDAVSLCKQYAEGTAIPPRTGYGQPKWQDWCTRLKEPDLETARSRVREEDFYASNRDRPATFGPDVVTAEPVPFDYDHSSIVKPTGKEHPVYVWVDKILNAEFVRLASHTESSASDPPARRLCKNQDFVAER